MGHLLRGPIAVCVFHAERSAALAAGVYYYFVLEHPLLAKVPTAPAHTVYLLPSKSWENFMDGENLYLALLVISSTDGYLKQELNIIRNALTTAGQGHYIVPTYVLPRTTTEELPYLGT